MKSFKQFKKEMEEEVPVNVSGNVAGTTGDPPVSKKKQKEYIKKAGKFVLPLSVTESEKFGGAMVFEIDSDTFCGITQEKLKSERFSKYIKDSDCLSSIREYAKSNPQKDIVVKDSSTGSYRFLKKGSKSLF